MEVKTIRFRLLDLLVLEETPELDRLKVTYSTSLNDCLYVFAVRYGRFPEYQLHRGYDDDLCCHYICRKGEENDSRKPAIIELPDGCIRYFFKRERAAGYIRMVNHILADRANVAQRENVLKIIEETAEDDKRRFVQTKHESRKRLSRMSLRPACRSANRVYLQSLQFTGK